MNQNYKENRVLALKLTYSRIRELFQKNKEILEKHLTLLQRKKLGSLKEMASVPSHAILTEAVNILLPIFTEINKQEEQWECERLFKYLVGWAREEISRN